MGTEARISHALELEIEPGARLRMPNFIFNRWVMGLERFGLVVRGVLYALVGVFAIAAMLGLGESVDLQGSVTLVLAHPLKVPVGILAAAGLFGYALWGMVRALADPLERGGSLHGIVSRVGFLWSAAAYTGLAWFALQFALLGTRGAAGLPFGLQQLVTPEMTPWLLGLFGIVVVITGLGQFMDAWIAPFRNDFLMQTETPNLWATWIWAGRLGLFARGIAFSLIGVLMIWGGYSGDLAWNYGLTRMFAVLLGLPAGAALLLVVSFGFVALGLQSVTSPPVLRMKPGLLPAVRRRAPKEI
jgi:uncharacterized protein DUF1206